MCVVTDAPACERLTSVSVDLFTVGSVGGELLSRFLPGGGDGAFFTGWLGTEGRTEKLLPHVVMRTNLDQALERMA